MKIFLALFLYSVLCLPSLAIRCFQCNSNRDPECRKDGYGEVNCWANFDSCLKLVLDTKNEFGEYEDITTRECSIKDSCDDLQEHLEPKGVQKVIKHCSICRNNLCNSGRWRRGSVLLIGVVGILIFVCGKFI